MSEKLDNLSKILLATGAINYMASAVDSVNEQMKFVPDPEGVHKPGITERDDILQQTWIKLGEIMENLADVMNSHDCICPIDVRATKAAFDIIIHKKDDVNK